MNWKIVVLAALGTVALVASPADAITLTNEDDATYDVEVLVGEGAAAMDAFKLENGEVRGDFCPDGCVLKLDNGTEQYFDGNEDVTIKDGEFAFPE